MAEEIGRWRRRYERGSLLETDVAGDPFTQFGRWLAEALAERLPEPNAMVLATADAEGQPSTRTVLLKGYVGGFRFFSNGASRKGRELSANPRVSLCFPWHAMERQVLVLGAACPLPDDEVAAYFASRPYESRIGALASAQSAVVHSREVLDRRYAELAATYPEGTTVPVPEAWGGWRVTPASIEFWQGRPGRLHDRLRYRAVEAGWALDRLSP